MDCAAGAMLIWNNNMEANEKEYTHGVEPGMTCSLFEEIIQKKY